MIQEVTDIDIKYLMDKKLDYNYRAAYLEKNGFERIDAGTKSSIYAKSGYNRLIKMNFKYDFGAFWYMQYCKKNFKKNPYLPKVYYYTGSGASFIAIMELLKWTPKNKPSKDESKILNLFNSFIYSVNIQRSIDKYRELIKFKDHKLYQLLYDLYIHQKKGVKFMFDITATYNILYRPRNNHLVIVDPLSS